MYGQVSHKVDGLKVEIARIREAAYVDSGFHHGITSAGLVPVGFRDGLGQGGAFIQMLICDQNTGEISIPSDDNPSGPPEEIGDIDWSDEIENLEP